MTEPTVLLTPSLDREAGVLPVDRSRLDTLLRLVAVLAFGALAAGAKTCSLHLGIPGHSGVLWLGAMLAGRVLVNRHGSGLLLGMSTAAWGVPLGLGHPFAHNLLLYGAAGAALDLACRIPGLEIRTCRGAAIAGMLAHLVKFLFIIGSAFSSTVMRHVLVVGALRSAALHLFFGVLAGLLGLAGGLMVRELARKALERLRR